MNVDKNLLYYGQGREEMIKYVPLRTKTTLDIGCGEGVFSSLLKKRIGVEAWGIEINVSAAEVAVQHLDKVLIGNAIDLINQVPDKYFDCIIFNDVLEHMIDPYTLLRLIKNSLSAEGVVIASIPNIRHAPIMWDLLVNGNWTYQNWGVLDKTHLRFFTKKSIKKMFEEQDYTILKIDGINRSESFRGKLISKLLMGPLSDMQYIQFACLAKPN